MLLILGLAIHECSTAFFTAACGKYSVKEAIFRTLKLPAIYTSLVALALNLFCKFNIGFLESQIWYFKLIDFSNLFFEKFVGAYSLLGMLIVGLGLAKVKEFKFNLKFISLALISKFIFFPGCALLFALYNQHVHAFYSKEALEIIFLMSIVPIGANAITLSNELNLDTDLVSITVALSNIVALIYIPIVLAWYF
jgi:predicted permease